MGELDGSRLPHGCASEGPVGSEGRRGGHAGQLAGTSVNLEMVDAARTPTAAVTGSSQLRPLSVWQGPLENDLVVHVALIAESQR